MRQARVAWQGVLFLVGALLCPAALEAAAASRLVYGRAAGTIVCPEEAELRAAVRARLGYDPFFPWAEQTIVVHVGPRPNRRLSGKVYLVDAQGHASPEREFTVGADECNELVLSMALAIAITLDPVHGSTAAQGSSSAATHAANNDSPADARRSPSQTSGVGEPASTAATPTTSNVSAGANPGRGDKGTSQSESAAIDATGEKDGATPPPNVDPAASPARAHLAVGAGVLGATGVMPGLSVGFAPLVRVRRTNVSFAIEGRLEVLALRNASGENTDVSLFGGAFVPCAHVGRLVGCVPLLLAQYRAAGSEVEPKEATALFSATGIRAGLEIPLQSGNFGYIHADLLVNTTRHEILRGGQSVWQVPMVSFTISAGGLATIL